MTYPFVAVTEETTLVTNDPVDDIEHPNIIKTINFHSIICNASIKQGYFMVFQIVYHI